jgi:VWFA-related protein
MSRLPSITALALAIALSPSPAQEPLVIQTQTHVVLVNVVAKDKHGKPVEDLARDDFELRDNGQDQKIGLFAREEVSDKAAAPASLSALTFTNRPAGAVPNVTAFLFDELNTSLSDQELAKKDFVRYLQTLPANSRVAVFVLGDSLTMLHDFSRDMASLLAALGKHSGRVNPEVEASTSPPGSSNSLVGDQTTTAQWDSFMKASSQPYADFSETVRATRTAAALQTIAGHLQGIPGRKTLIWISGGFPIQLGLRNAPDIPQSDPGIRTAGRNRQNGGASAKPGSQTTGGSGVNPAPETPGTGYSFESDVAKAIRALNEADVAVYPVDARGIVTAAPLNANRASITKPGKRPPTVANAADYNYETLDRLARETGGQSFHHLNDLSTAIQQAASDSRVTYSLTFSPSEGNLDGSYHQLALSVKRPGVELRYRPGYVAARDPVLTPTLADAIANPVALAGIGFTVRLQPADEGYQASVNIDPRNISFEMKNGMWTGSLQFLVVVGKVEQLTTIPLSFTETKLRQIQADGLTLGARVKTPPGTSGFSIGFRDIPTGTVGTLHVHL